MPPNLPTFPDISVRELFIPGPERAPLVRVLVYVPTTARTPLPALLWIHGGGYVIGIADQDDLAVKTIVSAVGCAVVSVDYRLAPETPHSGPVEDCYAALKWLSTHAGELGIDPTRIAIGGASAGGGLAAGLALLTRDRGEVPLVFQLLIYPMLDDRTVTSTDPHPYTGEFVWTPENNRFGWRALLGQEPGGPAISPYAAAARASHLEGLPPTFIGVGALDLFQEEDLEYAHQLMRAGVPTELHVYPGAFHAFDMAMGAKVSQSAQRDRLDALVRSTHQGRQTCHKLKGKKMSQQANPVFVVTGGAGGMGRACARQLGTHGLLLLTDVAAEALEQIAQDLRAEGFHVETHCSDVSNEESVRGLAERTHALGVFRGIAHTAGLSPTMANWQHIIQVDLVGTARLLHAFLPLAEPDTAVVCIASMAGHLINASPAANRTLEARVDVLTYTSMPLEQDLEVIGPVQADLFVQSSREHTDFFVRLCDVDQKGRSINVCDALLRVTPGHPLQDADGTQHLAFDLWPTAHRFRSGHRLRVQVSSGAHPRYARNPGGGEPLGTATKLLVADQSIYHDPAHPSGIILFVCV